MKLCIWKRGLLAIPALICFLPVSFAFAAASQQPPKQHSCDIKPHPSIHVKELEYNFGQIYEGSEAEHEFLMENVGGAELVIDNVRVDCGCTAVKFDAKIPPGGKGLLKMKVSLKNYVGKVDKKATIHSNDPQDPELVVRMQGTVVPLIDIQPSTDIIFRGMADQLSEWPLNLTQSTASFHITGTESNLGDNVSYRLETVEDGKHYRLTVANKLKRGNYGGFIKLTTDMAQKPDIIIRVSGFIEGEISVKPQNILIGKLSANQPERVGKIVMTSNRNQPFEITRMVYDSKLMAVTWEPSGDQTNLTLEVKPKLENVPVGARKQSTIKIETSAAAGEQIEIMVHLFNSSDQQELQQK